jgi:5-methylcytosine-specific restriction endonuclease McrA
VNRGSKWRRIRLLALRRDGNRCQICGDVAPIQFSPYGSLHVHHIVPRSMGGPDSLDNAITVCDLCHGGMHPHLWPSWFPQIRSADEDLRTKTLNQLQQGKEDYDWFCRLPPDERRQVQDEFWATLGIGRG